MSTPRLLPALLLLAACGDDASSGSPDAEVPDAGVPDATTAICEPGASVSATIGAAGGALALCGGRLGVEPGVLDQDVTFTITEVEPPAPFPPERAPAGAALRFEADVDPLPGVVSIDVPVEPGEGYLHLYRHDGEGWAGTEACRAGDGILGQDLGVLGTFVAMRSIEVFPESPEGLGEGTVDVVLDDVGYPFTLDEASRGIFEDNLAGDRAITLYLWYTPKGGSLKVLDAHLAVPVEGEAGVVAVSWTDLEGPTSYSYIDGLTDGAASLALDPETAGDRYVGTLNVELVDAEEVSHFLTADFDVTVEEYEFPPELSCPGGE